MRRFVDDDPGYLRWLAEHADGFVINAARAASSAEMVLHRASCRTISGVPTRGSQWTGPYIKLCGDRGELESFALSSLGASARGCSVCLRERNVKVPQPTRASTSSPELPRQSRSESRNYQTATSPATAGAAELPPRFLRPDSEPFQLAVQPRLASWNKAGDPEQIRLDEFLRAAEELLSSSLQRVPDPLALRLDVGLPPSVRLLDSHDLDNYLFPLITRLSKTTGRHFASVWATKQHAAQSFIRVEPARLDPSSGSFDRVKILTTTTSSQSAMFKQEIWNQLTGLAPLAEGPISLHLGFIVGQHRNWSSLWKPVIDSLDQILGRTRLDRDWHPRDGRIIELGLHCRTRANNRNETTIALGATALPNA